MNQVDGGISLPFEVTFDSPSLAFVAMKVYDVTVGEVLVATTSMVSVDSSSTYRAKFTADQNKSYVVRKNVYTDGTYTVIDPDHPFGSSESFLTKDAGSSSSEGSSLVAFLGTDFITASITGDENILAMIEED